jgi:hypothetical protein
VVFGGLFAAVATVMALGLFAAVADANGDYVYSGTVGVIGNAPTMDKETLVNPLLLSHGNDGNIYVYNDSAAMTGADGTHRVITRFDSDGDNPEYILIQIPSGFVPKGMTVSASGEIYLTPANAASVGGGLVAAYDTTGYAGAQLTPVYLGTVSGFSSTGNLGVPTINQTTGNVLVSGQFIKDSQAGVLYGVAEIDRTTGLVAKFLVTTNGSNISSATIGDIVAAPDGNYFATGYFQIDGQSYDVIKFDGDTGNATPIAPPNITGNGYTVAQWTISSVNIDKHGNIYLSGQAGVSTTGGQWVGQFSIVKLDDNANFVSTVALMGTSSIEQIDQLGASGLVSIDTDDETVYVLDKNTSGMKALKVYKVNVVPPTPPTDVTVDPNDGTVTWNPPDDTGGTGNGGYTITIVPDDDGSDSVAPVPDPDTTTGTPDNPVTPSDDGTDDGMVDFPFSPTGGGTIVTDNTTGGVRMIGMVDNAIYTVYVSAYNHAGSSPPAKVTFMARKALAPPNTGKN